MKKGDWITFDVCWNQYGELIATEDDPLVGKVTKVRKCGCCGNFEPIAGGRFWRDRAVPDEGYSFVSRMDEYETFRGDDNLPAWAWAKIAEEDMSG